MKRDTLLLFQSCFGPSCSLIPHLDIFLEALNLNKHYLLHGSGFLTLTVYAAKTIKQTIISKNLAVIFPTLKFLCVNLSYEMLDLKF